ADDAARALFGDRGGRPGLERFAGGVAEVMARTPAVVLAAGHALLEAAGHARARAAALEGPQRRQPGFAVVAHAASLGPGCRRICDEGDDAGHVARGLALAAFHPGARRLAARRVGGLPGAARRLDHPAEARAGGHAQLAVGPGAAALPGLLHLPRVRAAADPPAAAAPRAQPGAGGLRLGLRRRRACRRRRAGPP